MARPFVPAVARSLAMTVVSEFGDETFIIAALMAMRHKRLHVLVGALGALWTMTALSAVLGWFVPQLLSPRVTHTLATALFFAFGAKLVKVGLESEDNEFEEEVAEVKKQLRLSIKREKRRSSSKRSSAKRVSVSSQPEDEPCETDQGLQEEQPKTKRLSNCSSSKRKSSSKRASLSVNSFRLSETIHRLDLPDALKPLQAPVEHQVVEWEKMMVELELAPIIGEVFALIFLAEWGDRSQIATITLAADNNPLGVVIGAMLAHAICTSAAVMIGNHVAQYVSQKVLAFAGAGIFFSFGIFNAITMLR